MSIDWTKPLKWHNNLNMTVAVFADDIDGNKIIKLGLKHDPAYTSYVLVNKSTGRACRHGQWKDDHYNYVSNVVVPKSIEERLAFIEQQLGIDKL